MNLTHTVLENAFARLEPLEPRHREELAAAADADPSIFAHWPRSVGGGYGGEVDWLLGEQTAGRWLVHAVFSADGAIVGQSCFLNIRADHDGVEIGGTWYRREAQGGAVNPASKLLLLGHAFACGAERVELKTDARNARSRAAIEKLGAQFEGVFRRHMRRPDGTWRDTAWYSVLRAEWPEAQARLIGRLQGMS